MTRSASRPTIPLIMPKVLVIGGGGREHVLCDMLARSDQVERVYCAPGNAGTASVGENVPISPDDHSSLLAFVKEKVIDLTMVGPEAPLCAGIVDRFQAAGQRIFGPTAAAARIEGDKAYAKKLMKLANVPTAEARIFQHYDDAKSYIASRDTGIVIKAAGLAAGKGVSVCPDPADALLVLEKMMVGRAFGSAGDTVVVEELLQGQELSVFALVDGHTIYVLETAQDHKALGEGDTGPNTGGMGAYSPAPIATEAVLGSVERNVLVPIVDALRNDDAPYRGVLYVGLMLTAAGPKVLEFNCRFGDPEAQALLVRLDSDLYELLDSVVSGTLDRAETRWTEMTALCVVMASQGYPGDYTTGKVISGLDRAEALANVRVFHSGTKLSGEKMVTNGGRVLGVTALGTDLAASRIRAYEAVDRIQFEGACFRRDIGLKAVQPVPVSHC